MKYKQKNGPGTVGLPGVWANGHGTAGLPGAWVNGHGTAISMGVWVNGHGIVILMGAWARGHGIVILMGAWAKGHGTALTEVMENGHWKFQKVRRTAEYLVSLDRHAKMNTEKTLLFVLVLKNIIANIFDGIMVNDIDIFICENFKMFFSPPV